MEGCEVLRRRHREAEVSIFIYIYVNNYCMRLFVFACYSIRSRSSIQFFLFINVFICHSYHLSMYYLLSIIYCPFFVRPSEMLAQMQIVLPASAADVDRDLAGPEGSSSSGVGGHGTLSASSSSSSLGQGKVKESDSSSESTQPSNEDLEFSSIDDYPRTSKMVGGNNSNSVSGSGGVGGGLQLNAQHFTMGTRVSIRKSRRLGTVVGEKAGGWRLIKYDDDGTILASRPSDMTLL